MKGLAGGWKQLGQCDIFNRSIAQYRLWYTGCVGDGDTNTYKKVCDQKPYGEFGNAIRAHPNDIVSMRKAVWAVFFHKKSSDEDPTHSFCDASWCPYLKAEQERKPYTHSSSYLPSAVMDVVKPVWKDLCKTQLL